MTPSFSRAKASRRISNVARNENLAHFNKGLGFHIGLFPLELSNSIVSSTLDLFVYFLIDVIQQSSSIIGIPNENCTLSAFARNNKMTGSMVGD